jgi:hypothetical protein
MDAVTTPPDHDRPSRSGSAGAGAHPTQDLPVG